MEQAVRFELMRRCMELTWVLMDSLGLRVPSNPGPSVLAYMYDFLGHPLTVMQDGGKVFVPQDWIYQTELLLAFKETYEPCRSMDQVAFIACLRVMHDAVDKLAESQPVSREDMVRTLKFFSQFGIFLGLPFEDVPAAAFN